MTKQDRTTLKSVFRDGALPDAEDFADLIDSTVNQVDDGFEKTAIDGLRLHSIGRERRVLSFFEGLGADRAAWVAEHGDAKAKGALHLRTGAYSTERAAESAEEKAREPSEWDIQPGLTLAPDGNVGISRDRPEHRLDVGGVARMWGRTGMTHAECGEIVADGRWHPITPTLTGCEIFEVTAGASAGPKKGRYALLYAIAMNAYNPRHWLLNWIFRRRHIRHQMAVYGNFADRLKLRWKRVGSRHDYRLEIRTMANFGKQARIRYAITRLWHDPLMSTTLASTDEDGAG